MSDKTALGDRMKAYENRCQYQLMPGLPVVARLDGRNFSQLTASLQKPFDQRLSDGMANLTRYLVEQTCASVGYTQSDEISLVWWARSSKDERFFGNKMSKLVSVIGSMASVWFNKVLGGLPEFTGKMPVFDNRVFELPAPEEVANYFIWREQDAIRNSLQGAARRYFDHDRCLNLDTSELNELLHSAGVNWNDYPAHFKRGIYARRQLLSHTRTYSQAEIAQLPPRHKAHENPTILYRRPTVVVEELPIMTQIANQMDVLLRGAEPQRVIPRPNGKPAQQTGDVPAYRNA